MANAFTQWLNLTKPEVGADNDAWGGHLNGDLDTLDAVFTPDGTGTGVGLNIPAATTTTTYTLNMSGSMVMNGILTGTGQILLSGTSPMGFGTASPASQWSFVKSNPGSSIRMEINNPSTTAGSIASFIALTGTTNSYYRITTTDAVGTVVDAGAGAPLLTSQADSHSFRTRAAAEMAHIDNNGLAIVGGRGLYLGGSSSGSTVLVAAAAAGGTLTAPAVTGTLATTANVAAALVSPQIRTQIFGSSGTYTPDPHLLYAIWECVGGGGGGGGAVSAGANIPAGGGGGGGGGYAKSFFNAPYGPQTVVVGAGGTGGSSSGGNGGNGGDTVIVGLLLASGGTGGQGCTSAAGAIGGAGGVPGVGAFTVNGSNGQHTVGYVTTGIAANAWGGQGGDCFWGGGAQTVFSSGSSHADGAAADNVGGGGGGGASVSGSGGATGGAGGIGWVIITEFCYQ